MAGEGEKDHVAGSRKNGGATGCGKAAWWKSQKADFPTTLGNPANPAGFPLSHSPDDYGRLTKIDIPFSTKRGHFYCRLTSVCQRHCASTARPVTFTNTP